MANVGEDKSDEVISTTITAYAISSILTGAVFFLMGVCSFGYIVGFIPRHILIGCIGGVGWFLIATGFEVTARLDGNLNYDGATLRKMFQLDTIFLWLIPLVLAVFLYSSTKKITSKYYLPTFILIIPAIFYFFVLAIDELDPTDLRNKGWIFNGPDAGEPWWYFYTLYGRFAYLNIEDNSLKKCFSNRSLQKLTLIRFQTCTLGCSRRNYSSDVRIDLLRRLTCAYQRSSSCVQRWRRPS